MNTQEKTRFLLLDRLEQVIQKMNFINNEMKSEYINSFLKKLYKLEFKFLSNYKMLLDNYLTKNKYNIKHHEQANESAFILLEFAQNVNDTRNKNDISKTRNKQTNQRRKTTNIKI